MGTRRQRLRVVFDTASDWLSIEGRDCSSCTGDKYNYNESSQSKQVSEETSERSYGSVLFFGKEYTDQVCVADNICIDDFEFFMIEQQMGLFEPIDGVLGLARNKPFLLSGESEVVRGPSLMNALSNANRIPENTFSLMVQQAGRSSLIDFGAPQSSRLQSGASLAYIPLEEDFFFSAFCQGIAIGDTSSASSYNWQNIEGQEATIRDNAMYSIFDSGATAVILPQYYFTQVLGLIYAKIDRPEYEVQNNYVVTKCDYELPDLFFMFAG